MTERTTLLQEVGAALRDHGITAAITALTCPHSNVLAHANAAQGPKRLIGKRI